MNKNKYNDKPLYGEEYSQEKDGLLDEEDATYFPPEEAKPPHY